MSEQEHPGARQLRLCLQQIEEAVEGIDRQELENAVSHIDPRMWDLYLLTINNARYWLDSVERLILEEPHKRSTLTQQMKAEGEA
jgi:hypothetical protein